MVQKVKKSKKKVISKPNTSINAAKSTISDQNQFTSPVKDEQNNKNWTPMQLEQIELSKKLDTYIGGFQKKVLRLNFQPSNRELVILFIMNLHPRWRRMVEPVELSCSSWVEAAAFARLHCARVSAILGCENRSDAIFKSSNTRALRDSGYFAPDDSDLKFNTPASISHLLNPEEDIDSDKSDTESKSGFSPASSTTAATTTATALASASTSASASASATIVAKTVPITVTEEKQPLNGSKKIIEEEKSTTKEKAKASPSVSPSISHSFTSESSQTLKPDTKVSVASSSSSPSPPTKAQMQVKVQQAIKNRKEKEKEKKVQGQLQQQKKQLEKMSTIAPDQMGTVLTNVPKQHMGVNLTFLELSINGKKVKGLLAKLSWGSSAISIDCANRLGLDMKPSDHLCINTDFGYVDSVGILTLPIHHPADPSRTKSEMDIQVLPMIYGGKVDLVLGADFFCFYNPTFNIRIRAIRFLEKETPYVVEKLAE
ncbi:hypothetical protein INT46_008189 [Mucor plumbeus]|uniref:Uncharacterized protein n=1 Tax=Mucor plumbeus TaxID=97098 RepID=A0A8H7RK18_9FUNG|nr:hypothetical protein INT46_008189 [Mucor plumbeus]